MWNGEGKRWGLSLSFLMLAAGEGWGGYNSNQAPAVIIGQNSITNNNTEPDNAVNVSSIGFYNPYAVVVSTVLGKTFVADTNNSRVLIFNSTAPIHGEGADLVLGHPNFSNWAYNDNGSNVGGAVAANNLNGPQGVALINDSMLAVSDTGNNRVLIWTTIPTSNGQSANLVLGQPNLTSNGANSPAISSATFWNPEGISSHGGMIFVGDSGNNRILIWNSPPTFNGQGANLVLGQPNFTSNAANSPSISSQTLYNPTDAAYDGVHLVAADRNNQRILIWNSLPTLNGQGADVVIGASNFTSAGNIAIPQGVASDGNNLYVTSPYANPAALMVWNPIPTINGAAPSLLLGGYGTSPTVLANPVGIYISSGSLFVSDAANNRIMIWNLPLSAGQAANQAFGHQGAASNQFYDLTTNAGPYANGINNAIGVSVSQNKLAIDDNSTSRVLLYNSIPQSNGASADLELGQPDLKTITNPTPPSASSLYNPRGVSYDGQNIFVADNNNQRILIWNSWPTANDQAANIVLGQPNFTSNAANNGGGTSATGLYYPADVMSDGRHLYVADQDNQRILIWNSLPTINDQGADLELGQPNFTSNAPNNGGLSAASLQSPLKVFSDGQRLYVADGYNDRILIWNSIPKSNDQPADVVVGQNNFTSNSCNQGGSTNNATLCYPSAVYSDGRSLYVSDTDNYRLLIWNEIPTVNGAASDEQISDFYSPQAISGDGSSLYASNDNDTAVTLWYSTAAAADKVYVYISTPSVSPLQEGQIEAFARVDIWTGGNTHKLSSLRIFNATTLADSSLQGSLYLDSTDNGTESSFNPNVSFSSTTDGFLNADIFAASSATLSANYNVAATTTTFWLALSLNDLPYPASLLPKAGIAVMPNYVSLRLALDGSELAHVSSTFIESGQAQTEALPHTVVMSTANSSAEPSSAYSNQNDIVMAALTLKTTGDFAFSNAIKVYQTGNAANSDASYALYLDSNGNGIFDPTTDAQLGNAQVSVGTATISLSPELELSTNTATVFIVATINTLSSSEIGNTLGVRVDTNSLVYDGVNISSTTNFPYSSPLLTLAAALVNVSVLNQSSGVWTNNSQFIFSGNFGSDNVSTIRYVWDQNPTHSWTDTEALWSSGYSTQTAVANGSWYFHAKAYDSGGTGGTSEDLGPLLFDGSPPAASGFESFNAAGNPVGESQVNVEGSLSAGVTAQITIQDTGTGLAVSTDALPFAGDGHDDPQTTSGFGVMYSTDAGSSWVDYSTATASALGSNIRALAVFNGKLYAGDSGTGKIYVSADGNSWSATNGGAAVGLNIQALTAFNGKLYAGDDGNGKIYVSADGNSWSTTNGGAVVGSAIVSLATFNGKLYAGNYTNGYIYVSADGNSWTTAVSSTVLGSVHIFALAVFNGKLYAGDYGNGKIYVSADGNSWSATNGGAAVGLNIQALSVFNGKLYAGDYNGNIYVSADGNSWSAVNGGGTVGSIIAPLAAFNGKLYAGDSGTGKIYVSTDGNSWNTAVSSSAIGSSNIQALAGFNGKLYAGDGNGKIYQITPVTATLSGSNGTNAAQTLSATGLNLAASTNSIVCGGVAPCGATNQIIFTGSDMAGNVKTAGPFAIEVTTLPTVIASLKSVAPATLPQNTDAAFIQLTLNTLNGTAPWTGIALNRLGSGTDQDVQNVAVYADNSGVLGAQLTSNATFSGGQVTLSFPSPPNIVSSTQSYFVGLTAAPAATDGDALQMGIVSTAAFSFSGGYGVTGFQSAFISSSALITDGPNYLYLQPISQSPADASPGSVNIPTLALKGHTNTGTSTFKQIVFHLHGTATSSDISSIALYKDANGTGVYASNDTLVTSGNDAFTNGVSTVVFQTSASSATLNTVPVYYFALVSLAVNANLGDTILVSIDTTSDVGLVDVLDTTTFVNSSGGELPAGTPAESSTMTVEYVNTLNVLGVNEAPASFVQSQEYAVLKTSLTVSVGQTGLGGISVARTGVGQDQDVSAVKFWQDPSPPEAFNPATFIYIASGVFSSGLANLSFPVQTLDAGTTYVYFVTYDISPTANAGDSLGAEIQSSLSIADANSGTSVQGAFPILSSTAPVVATQSGLYVSWQNLAPVGLLQGATNQQMMNLTLDTTQYSLILSALSVASSGTATALDIPRLELYQDAVGNGILNVSKDPLLAFANDPFKTGAAALSPSLVVSTTPLILILAVDVSTTADYSHDFGLSIETESDLTVSLPNFVVSSTADFPENSSVVPILKSPDVMTPIGTSLINTSGVIESRETLAAEISVQTQHSSTTWKSVTINRDGTLPDSGIDAVRIYADSDGNGVWDLSDVLVGSGTFLSGVSRIVFFNPRIATPVLSDYFVTLVIDLNAPPGDTIGISLAGPSDFLVAPPDSVSGLNLPFASALSPVLDAKTPTVPIVSFPGGNFGSSFDSIYFIWSSTVVIGSISSATYAVGTTPGGLDVSSYTAIPLAASSYTASGLLLLSGGTYYISVEATSSYGFTSPAGTTPGLLVDLVTPQPPNNLTADTGPSAIDLSWTPGSAGPSGIVGYLLEYSNVEHPIWYNVKTGAVTAASNGVPARLMAGVPFLFNNPPQGTLLFRASSVNGAGINSSPTPTIRVLFGTQSSANLSGVSSYPNPFHSDSEQATIVYTLGAPNSIRIRIFSVFGNLVKDMSYPAGGAGGLQGVNTVNWDGTDSGGRKVSKGIYIAVLEVSGTRVEYKIGVIH